VLLQGTREDAETMREESLRYECDRADGIALSPAKTQVVHMSGGFDFLGFRIQWKRARERASGTSTPSSEAAGPVAQRPLVTN
jgi:hypothetical protein